MLKTSGLPNIKFFLFYTVLLLPSLATGQSVLEEIVVIAQKREQNLQDVGISVTAFSGDQLRALGMEDTTDLETQIPGLLIGEYGGAGATTTLNIRGVAQLDFADHQESPNAVYVDGTYVSFIGGVNVSMFDLERVEVLRGPQGTLFGRNATGGLIHLITKKTNR
jgi:iron complex outermembrane receptor protein